MADEKTEKTEQSKKKLTEDQITTERTLGRRSFLTAVGAVVAGGAAALALGDRLNASVPGRAQSMDPDKKPADPDKKPGDPDKKPSDPDKKKMGDPDKKKRPDPDKKRRDPHKKKPGDPDKKDPDKTKVGDPDSGR
ncbi:MAG TPA: hypothetical protein VFW94_08805 [Candidatus Acidoferrales bacterium]|nr:hypothetical protein [Candidatus Acidoferrales bacterium]